MNDPPLTRGRRLARWSDAMAAVSGWRRFGLAFVLGAVAAAALPPVFALPLAIPAFVGLLWLADRRVPFRDAFAAGWWFGFGHFIVGFYWIAFALLTDAARFGWMIPFAVGGLAAGLAFFPALAILCVRASGTAGWGRVLLFAAAWTAAEWLRGAILTGFPWNLMGHSWAVSDSMNQLAAVTGVWGLTFVTILAASIPAVLSEEFDDSNDQGRGSARWSAVAVVYAFLALIWVGGTARLPGKPWQTVPGVSLRLVQANIDQTHKWRKDLRAAHFASHLELSRPETGRRSIGSDDNSARRPPNIVIWPETAVPYSLATNAAIRRAIATVVPKGGILITGAIRTTPRGIDPFRIWNSIHALDATGAVVATYDKAHLVPFGEYLPFRPVLGLTKIAVGPIDFSTGLGPETLSLKGFPAVRPLICYEAIFPSEIVVANNRPAWMLNLTNDAWFGISSGPYQHFTAARLRSVEQGIPLVRAANTGISAVVDPYGRITAILGLGVRGILDASLPKALATPTPYARFGDRIVFGLMTLGAVTGWWFGRRRIAPISSHA